MGVPHVVLFNRDIEDMISLNVAKELWDLGVLVLASATRHRSPTDRPLTQPTKGGVSWSGVW